MKVKKKRKTLAGVTDNEVDGNKKQARKLMMIRERERRKENCIFTFLGKNFHFST